MATPDNARQQTATQQQDGNSVVFSDTNLTKLDEKQIKRIGLYTASDLAEINQLLTDLHRVFTKENGLIDRQKIYLRLNGETRITELTTELNFPETFEPSERRSRLFLSDLARIIIGLAKTFYAIWQDDNLREFTQSFDELDRLAEWTSTADGEYISEFDLARNAYKLQELLDLVTEVFEQQAGVDVPTQVEPEIEAEVAPQPLQGTATVPEFAKSSTTTETQADAESDTADEAKEETVDPRTNSTLATEALFISSTAYFNLITQFLDSAGLVEANLPPELQRQLAQLNQSLKDKLWDIIENLPPEQREQLLAHGLRIFLYQKLLLELQKDPLFYTLLNQFYQNYTQFIYEQNGASVAEERINDIERYFETITADTDIDTQELNEVLEKIRAEIKAWKAQILAQVEAEKKPPLEADKDGDGVIEPDELEDYAVTRLTPPKLRFLAQQESQLDSHFSAVGFDPQRRRIVQDQSARMLWGTLAELFKDDVEQLNRLPQHIRDEVYNQTLTYIMGLSLDELETLRTSPSSLIRHIKNNSFRILGDAQFQHDYSQYTETKTATVISRANRIEKETEWAYQQLSFELFGAHNITDPTVPDTPELQGVFDEVKVYLRETVFAYIEQMPTEDLLHLYLHSKDRQEFLREIHKYLNTDQVFVENISLFYNNLLVHYETIGQIAKRDELQSSLNTMAQYDGRFFRVRAATPSPEILLDNSVEKLLKPDSKLLLDQSDITIRTLVLNLGLEDTLSLIQKNRGSILESVFQLPPGTLTDANIEEYRTLLSEYARLRSSELIVTTAGSAGSALGISRIRAMYPGLHLDLSESASTTVASETSSVVKQLESVRTIQTVVQSSGKDGDEIVAEALDAKTIKQKRDVVMKIFGSEWGRLSQADQVAIYLYYDLPFNEQSVKADINNQLPFPFEYIDFRAKKDYDKLLGKITEEYLKHGKKGFNQYLTAEYLDDKTNSAERQRKVNQLVLQLQAYDFAQREADEQLAIAQLAGYASAAEFVAQQNAVFQAALTNTRNAEIALQQLELIDAYIQEDLAAQISIDNQVYLQELQMAEAGGYVPALESGDGTRSAAVATAPSFFSPKQHLANAFKKLAGKKVKEEVVKKGATTAASAAAKAGLGAATAGVGTAIVIAGSLLQNKKFREFVIYGTTALVSSLLYALSTVGGLLGALLGASFGFLAGGPFAALTGMGGGLVGAYTGAQLFPQQWGGWMGFSPRQAPGLDMLYPENNASITDASMQAARAANTNQAAAAAANSAQSLGGASTPAASTTTTAAAATPATTAAATTGTTAAAAQAAASSSGFFSSFFGMSIGLASPIIALVSVTFMTGMAVLVIVGAFLVPIPIRDSNWKGDSEGTDSRGVTQEIESRYLDVEKTASITQIENNTATSVTYTIKVTPKNNHAVQITEVSDTFRKSTEGGPELISGVTEGSFPPDPITEPFEFSYDVMIGEGLTDTRVTNTLIVQFQAIDRNGFIPERNGLVRTSASVKVGDPVEGCWPTTGKIVQGPGGSYSHGTLDAYDIINDNGTAIYAPYSGQLCKQPFNAGGYGNYVTLTFELDGNELVLLFAHLQSHIVPSTQQCVQVSASELIARMDDNGYSSEPHLHYELRRNNAGVKISDLIPKEGGLPSNGTFVNDCN